MRMTAMVLVALAVVGACSGAEAGSGGGNVSVDQDQAQAAEQAAGRSACDLATEAEIGGFAGEGVTAKPGKSGRNYSTCEYWGATSGVPVVSVKAYFSGGQEAFEIYRSGMGMANDMWRAAEGVELDSVVKPGPVQGLGDAAVYAELVPSVVLEGDHFLELMLFYLPGAKAKFRPLAEMMLERM